MDRREQRRSVGVAAGIVAAIVLAATASASNFGSNTDAYQEPAHPCDTTPSSQCIANNGYHVYCFDASVSSNVRAATRTVMANVYDPLPYVSTAEFSCSEPGLDVHIIQRSYSNRFWAWTTCAADASYGGSDPHRWCKPQEVRWNTTTAGSWDTSPGRAYVACHEVGHSLGLRHTSDSASCMYPNRITTSALTAHDRTMLDYYNPVNLRAGAAGEP